MKELDKLIERLKKEYGENGVYALLRKYKTDLNDKRKKYDTFCQLLGFLWGLTATNYIDEETREKILDECR